MKVEVEGVALELVLGNIVEQDDLHAVVNAANAELRIGGGVAGAIHRGAGPELEKACRPLAPIEPGEAVVTDAFRLPNRWVIHCLGPVYGRDEPADELLAACYRNGLARAEEVGAASVGFPAISTGAFGYPMSEAADLAIRTVLEEAPELSTVKRIRFVLYGGGALAAHRRALEDALDEAGSASSAQGGATA